MKLACLSAAMLMTASSAAFADAMPLASHRAVYELTLGKTSGSRAPTGATGRIGYEFTGTPCEGYATTFRQVVSMDPAEGERRMTDMRSASFEGGQGESFRFRIESQTSGSDPTEGIDGNAQHAADGGTTIRLAKPRPAKIDLEPGILFPTEHVVKVIAAAKAGQPTLEAKVFDGSDTGEKVFDTLTVIGKPAEAPAPEAAAQKDELKGMARWPITISYFDSGKTDGAPAYVMSFDLYENGVSRALKIDYGDFVLQGEMTSLDFLAQKPCP